MRRALLVFLLTFAFSTAGYTAAKDIGVLVLAHGGSSLWNETVLNAVKPLEERYHVEVAFGMANPVTMEEALRKLEDKGVTEIVVVPLFVSSHSPIIRQLRYLLGHSEEPPRKPILMYTKEEREELRPLIEFLRSLPAPLSWWIQERKPPADVFERVISLYAEPDKVERMVDLYRKALAYAEERVGLIKPLKTSARIHLTDPLDDHDVVVSIVCERALELSRDPSRESLIIVAHGPNGDEDNVMWLRTMESIAVKCREHLLRTKGESFRNILSVTVRDDAPEPIQETAKQHLRALVRQLSVDGEVIVVPLLISQGGVEKRIAKRLEGLTFRWNGKTILPSEKITEFLEGRIAEALGDRARAEAPR